MSSDRFGKLRRHQIAILDVAAKIVANKWSKRIVVASVVPGGGKTLMASLFAHVLLENDIVDQVAVVVPRDSLRQQMRDGFTVSSRGLTRRLAAEGNKKLEQEHIFERAGYVTTIQAVATNPTKHLRKVKKHKTLLIIDEPHHISNEAAAQWRVALEPMVQHAEYVLLMSGTLFREDARPIAFVEYTSDGTPVSDIKYTRCDALEERAILPIDVKLYDGDTKYWHGHREHERRLSEARGKHESLARRTALWSPEYRDEAMGEALWNWIKYREHTGHKSKAIVICKEQRVAKHVAKAIRERFPAFRTVLAISDEPQSVRHLERFRCGVDGEILVTCQMAYEGLDVPSATHLIYLTTIRTEQWMDQALNRVTRPDYAAPVPVENQQAFIYAPNDQTMRQFIDRALDDQERVCNMDATQVAGDAQRKGPSTFKPVSADMAGVPSYGIVSNDGSGMFSKEEDRIVFDMRAKHPSLGVIPPATILDIYHSIKRTA